MLDVFYLGISLTFFAIAIAYVRGCETLREKASDE